MSTILKNIRAAFGDVEATPYTVVVQRGGYEERVYPARRWACTSMSGPSRHALVTPMFRRLFSYISGRNEPNIRIDMTTPVTTLVEPPMDDNKTMTTTKIKEEEQNHNLEDEGVERDITDITSSGFTSSCSSSSSSSSYSSSSHPTYTMAFLVPSSHQETPPSSADKNIFIEYRQKMSVLASRFSGYMNDEVVAREVEALRKAIINNGDEKDVDFSRYYVVGYDPPFKILGRRNEIWMVKKTTTADDDTRLENGDDNGNAVMANGVVMKVESDGDYVVIVNGDSDEMVNGGVMNKEVKEEEEEGIDG